MRIASSFIRKCCAASVALVAGLADCGAPDATAPLPTATALRFATAPAATARSRVKLTAPPVVELASATGASIAQAGVSVSVAITAGGGTLVGTTTVSSDASGQASFPDLSIRGTAGPRTLTFSASGLSPVTASIALTAGDPASMTINAAAAQSGVAGESLSIPPSVLVVDADSNPVAGASVTFAIASGGGTLVGAAQTTSSAGIATVGGWTLGKTAGTNSMTATVAGLVDTPVTFTVAGVAGAPAKIAENGGDNIAAVAGTAVPVRPSVRVTDANDNAVSGASVTFAARPGQGSVTGTTQSTDTAGIATVGAWTLGAAAGVDTLTATSAGIATAVVFTDTATAGSATALAVNGGNNQTATAGAAVATKPSAKVTDANGNAVPGITVIFAVSGGGGTLTGETQQTDQRGVATVGGWTLGTTAGANTVTATASGISVAPVTFTATAIAGPPTQVVLTTAPAATQRSRVTFPTQPVVQLRDAYGNDAATAGTVITASISSGGGTLAGNTTATTGASGSASFSGLAIQGIIGSRTLQFASPNLTAASSAISLAAGLPATIDVIAGTGQGAIVGFAVDTAPAVKLADADGNAVAGAAVTFSVVTGAGTVTGATPVTDADGHAAAGSWVLGAAGLNTLAADAGGGLAATITATAAVVTSAAHQGDLHACALTDAGSAYCWGDNTFGQLGDGTTTERHSPTLVAGGHTFVAIESQGYHTLALGGDGTLYAWGRNRYGQLGTSGTARSDVDRLQSGDTLPVLTPTPVAGGLHFTTMSTGLNFSIAVGTDGNTYSWGSNGHGQLGTAADTSWDFPTPVQVAAPVPFVALSAAPFSSFALSADGTAYAWGYNSGDPGSPLNAGIAGTILGDGSTPGTVGIRSTPVLVAGGVRFATISATLAGAVGVTAAGKAYGWGDDMAQFVTPASTAHPNKATALNTTLLFRTISTGFDDFFIGITPGEKDYGWGLDRKAGLGLSDFQGKLTPTPMVGTCQLATISAGGFGGVGVTTDGELCTWGFNGFGSLGTGDTTDRYTPTRLSTGLKWKIPP
jgi:adhesin/invasin